jgi:predicted hydrocarbon binding protein
LIEALELEVDEGTRESVLMSCGRRCISRSFVKKAQEIRATSEGLDGFLQGLGEEWDHLKVEDDGIYVQYDKCYCPFVRDYPEPMSPTWCHCSRGWINELFESTLGAPVGAEMLSSIRQGDEVCRFKVTPPSECEKRVPSYIGDDDSST